MGAENVTLVEGMYNSFAEGDVDAVLGAMAPDVEWREAEGFIYADGNPYIGPEAVAEGVFAKLGGEWEYWKLEGLKLYPAGKSNVLATGRYNAKNKASGKELDAQFAHFWTVADGKVSSFQQYTDTKQTAESVIVEAAEETEETEE